MSHAYSVLSRFLLEGWKTIHRPPPTHRYFTGHGCPTVNSECPVLPSSALSSEHRSSLHIQFGTACVPVPPKSGPCFCPAENLRISFPLALRRMWRSTVACRACQGLDWSIPALLPHPLQPLPIFQPHAQL